MIVTHLFQVLGFRGDGTAGVAVRQAPAGREGEGVRGAAADRSPARGPRPVPGYRSEPGVRAGSDTETMVALRAEVENWRWQGVPFFLRSASPWPPGARW